MTHRVAPRAETDLDDIWLYIAKESGSIELANRLIDTLTNRFFMLAGFPYVRRARDDDFGPGCRSVAVVEHVIVYCVENQDVLIPLAHGCDLAGGGGEEV